MLVRKIGPIGLKEEEDSELKIYYGEVYLGKLKLGEVLERPNTNYQK